MKDKTGQFNVLYQSWLVQVERTGRLEIFVSERIATIVKKKKENAGDQCPQVTGVRQC